MRIYGVADIDRVRAHFARADAEAASEVPHPAVARMREHFRAWSAVSGNAKRLASARGAFIEPLLDEALGVGKVRAAAGWDDAIAEVNAKFGFGAGAPDAAR